MTAKRAHVSFWSRTCTSPPAESNDNVRLICIAIFGNLCKKSCPVYNNKSERLISIKGRYIKLLRSLFSQHYIITAATFSTRRCFGLVNSYALRWSGEDHAFCNSLLETMTNARSGMLAVSMSKNYRTHRIGTKHKIVYVTIHRVTIIPILSLYLIGLSSYS